MPELIELVRWFTYATAVVTILVVMLVIEVSLQLWKRKRDKHA